MGSLRYLVEDRQAEGLSCGTARLVLLSSSGVVEDVPNDESSYEVKALVVFERSRSWFRVALKQGSAWIRRDDSNDFVSYPDLLKERVAYLREGWDGRLWQQPGTGAVALVPDDWRRSPDEGVGIELIGVQMVGGQAWLHVRLQADTCDQPVRDVKPISGWVPAYRASGATSAWFAARGC